jgi:predicted  nucleic acid-binding Zn-ribbon protein
LLTTAALDREITALKRELDLRINSLEQLITDRMRVVEERRVEQKQDTKVELDAALTAQKESVSKLETAFEKAVDNLRQEVGELKQGIDRITERKIGSSEAEGEQQIQRTAGNQAIGLYIAAAAALLSFGGIVVALIAKG